MTPSAFSLHQLSHNDIQDIIGLQTRVLDDLEGRGKGHYLKLRTEHQLQNHQDAVPHMPIYGIRNTNGDLVASVMMTYPDAQGDFYLFGYPFADLGPSDDKMAVIQGLIVDKSCEGHGLTKKLFNACAAHASSVGRDKLVAKIAADNAESIQCFARRSFQKAVDGTDIRQGYHVHFMVADTQDVLRCTHAALRMAG